MTGGSPAGHEMVAFGDIWRVTIKAKQTHLIVCGINFVIKVSNSKVSKVISECFKQLRSLFIGRMDTQSRRKYLGQYRVGTMRTVTACNRIVRGVRVA